MKRFVTIYHHTSPNKKTDEFYNIVKSAVDCTVLEDVATEMAFADWVKKLCIHLNEKYPKGKSIGIDYHLEGNFISICLFPRTSDTSLFEISFKPVRKEIKLSDAESMDFEQNKK